MCSPEDFEQAAEFEHLRIKVDLQSLGMISKTVIGRKLFFAARVADSRPIYAIDDPKLGVRSPESAQGEGGGIKVTRCGDVDRGDGHFVFGRQTHGTLPVI